MKAVIAFISAPEYYDYQKTQRSRFLHYTLMVMIVGQVLLGILNQNSGADTLAAVLYLSTILYAIIIFLNQRGHFQLAAGLVSIAMFALSSYNLVDGLGLHDPGIVVFPALILITTYLFGRHAVWFSTLGSILIIATIHVLYRLGVGNFLIHGLDHSLTITLTIVLIYVLIAFIIWLVYGVWERTLQRLQSAYDSTLEAWAKTLEFRDVETEGHSRRVSLLVEEFAEKLGFDAQSLNEIKRGALLHDIGKLSIPDEILFKPGPLTDEEWVIMKQHPLYAYELLQKIPFLQHAAVIPRYHHEYWDGSGYPYGLKGEEIPLEARMFTIIDHYDALLSDRPYRKAWSQQKALTYIRENANRRFEPRLVDLFLDLDSVKRCA